MCTSYSVEEEGIPRGAALLITSRLWNNQTSQYHFLFSIDRRRVLRADFFRDFLGAGIAQTAQTVQGKQNTEFPFRFRKDILLVFRTAISINYNEYICRAIFVGIARFAYWLQERCLQRLTQL